MPQRSCWRKNAENKRLVLVVYSIGILFFIFFVSKDFYKFVVSWIEDDPNGQGRFVLFASFPTAFFKSPIIGLGPGTHARNGVMEFHNSYLEFISMAGLLGAGVFIILSVRLFKTAFNSPLSLGVLVSGYMFGVSGFGARRLVYWVLVVLCYELASKLNNKVTISKSFLYIRC